MHEVSISYGSNVITKVKVDNRQTNKQAGQKQYDPDHSIPGYKNRIDRIEAIWNIRLNRQKIYKYRGFCASLSFFLPLLHRISLFYPKIAMFISFQLAIIVYALNKIMN